MITPSVTAARSSAARRAQLGVDLLRLCELCGRVDPEHFAVVVRAHHRRGVAGAA
jgi:hypothetical protein